MTASGRRRTLSVRGWFALASVTTFVMIVVAVFASVVLLGASDQSSSDHIDRAVEVLGDGADRWDDPEWLAATRAELASDDVSFVLSVDGDEIYRGGDGAGTVWDADRGDGAIRTVDIDGDASRTAQIYAPLADENPMPAIVRATVVIGAVAAAVSLAFGRPFVRPLGAVRRAADQVTEGDLTVSLPRSRVREVDAVSSAFNSMATELNRSLEQQAELESERRMFIAAIAHDLRTPLFSLRGHLEAIESGIAGTEERRARYLSIANENARTLDRLVADLFDYTRVEYLDQSLNRTVGDLSELLHDLVDRMQPQAQAKGLTLQFASSGPCLVEADREQLSRAATNLIDNALRCTPAGGRVDVASTARSGAVEFTVTDDGPGIDPEDLPHLFRPLYRGRNQPDTPAGGTGLGLSIAHRIITAHHGKVEAANSAGGGAVFTVTVPRKPDPSASSHGGRG